MDAFGTYTVGRQVTWAEKCKNAAFHTRRNMIRARERSQNNEIYMRVYVRSIHVILCK